jgi:hypothetical protein
VLWCYFLLFKWLLTVCTRSRRKVFSFGEAQSASLPLNLLEMDLVSKFYVGTKSPLSFFTIDEMNFDADV